MSAYIGPIKEIVHGIYDGPHATPPEADSGPIFLGIANVTESGRLDFSEIRHVSEEHYPKWTRRVTPQSNDIVFSYEATLHRYALIPEGFRGCLGRRMALVRPDTRKVVPRFLHYYFLSSAWRSVVEGSVVSGATVDRIPLLRFPDFRVRLPELSAQHRVVAILSAYDDLIENNRRRIQLLEQAARLLYQEWFVHLRFPGHEHVTITDGVPEGWERTTLGDVITLKRGYDLPSQGRELGLVPIVSSSGISGFHNAAKAKAPGVVTGRYGTLGSVYLIQEDFWPLNTALYVHDFKETDPHFTFHLLTHLLRGTTSAKAAVPGVNRNDLHRIEVLLPPAHLRQVFVKTVEPIHGQITTLEQHTLSLSKARDLLLPRLMNGEVLV